VPQLTALNEALLHNFKVASEEGVVLGQPRNFKERAEKEVRRKGRKEGGRAEWEGEGGKGGLLYTENERGRKEKKKTHSK